MRLIVRPQHLAALHKAAQLGMFATTQPGQRATVRAHVRVTKSGKVAQVKQHDRARKPAKSQTLEEMISGSAARLVELERKALDADLRATVQEWIEASEDLPEADRVPPERADAMLALLWNRCQMEYHSALSDFIAREERNPNHPRVKAEGSAAHALHEKEKEMAREVWPTTRPQLSPNDHVHWRRSLASEAIDSAKDIRKRRTGKWGFAIYRDWVDAKVHAEIFEQGEPGRHWGSATPSNKYARAVVAASGQSTMRALPSLKEEALPAHTLKKDMYRGAALRRYAQKHVAQFPRERHPNVWRGMALPEKFLRIIEPGDNIPLTGCTAFSFKEKVAHEYSSSAWTKKHAAAGSAGCVLTLDRTEDFDASIGMWHHDTKDKTGPAFEILSAGRELTVKSIHKASDGRYHIRVEMSA